MVLGADGKQGVFDFSGLVTRNHRRTKVRSFEAVPKEEVAKLQAVRTMCGFRYRDIGDICGLDVNFLSKAMTLDQNIRQEEFTKIKLALADLVFRKILEAKESRS